ncbi:hypothetical protein SNE40_021847 [Patella caerulea]|uniref:Uncharacterized protein n=1 Tax=Patella caerulea TaxID=87958 RepID=A0AAN8G8H7_PATCE
MANPKCVFEFRKKADLSPENVKGKEDKIEIRNGIDGIPIQPHANNNVNHSASHLQKILPIDVGSHGIPTSKHDIIEIQPEEATIEQGLQSLDGINDFESTANGVKMENASTRDNVTVTNCVGIKTVPTDDDVMNGVISIEIKNNEIPKPDVQMDNVVVNNLLSNDLANTEYTSDGVENTSVHSNAVSWSGDENEEFRISVGEELPSNNNKTDVNRTSANDNANDVDIIGNCTGNSINEESANETNEDFKNELEKNLENLDGKLDKNIKYQDTRLFELNKSGKLSTEVVMKSTDLLQTVHNNSGSITLLMQPTDTKNTGVLNNGYRNDEDENYTGAPSGDTGTEDTDHSFYGGQVSRPDADGQSIDGSTYYPGYERMANSDHVSENRFNKTNPREKKLVSVMNENIQPNGNQSGTDNSGFISDDDSIDTVVDIS